jgi:hypothetical protein
MEKASDAQPKKTIIPESAIRVPPIHQFRGRIQRKTWCTVWDPMPELTTYNLTLCPLWTRLQHIYHGQPYARVDFNHMP